MPDLSQLASEFGNLTFQRRKQILTEAGYFADLVMATKDKPLPIPKETIASMSPAEIQFFEVIILAVGVQKLDRNLWGIFGRKYK